MGAKSRGSGSIADGPDAFWEFRFGRARKTKTGICSGGDTTGFTGSAPFRIRAFRPGRVCAHCGNWTKRWPRKMRPARSLNPPRCLRRLGHLWGRSRSRLRTLRADCFRSCDRDCDRSAKCEHGLSRRGARRRLENDRRRHALDSADGHASFDRHRFDRDFADPSRHRLRRNGRRNFQRRQLLWRGNFEIDRRAARLGRIIADPSAGRSDRINITAAVVASEVSRLIRQTIRFCWRRVKLVCGGRDLSLDRRWQLTWALVLSDGPGHFGFLRSGKQQHRLRLVRRRLPRRRRRRFQIN